ncbi:MAG: methyltransferase domain-containing protein [Thermoplasmata archaeon]|nr:methyltransferase domain-containing protein [Thermoplasmata archaeon]
MPWKYTDRAYTEYTRTTWNESAATYDAWASNLGPYRADVVRASAARAGDRVLDLATGPGEPALTLARRVAPKGEVVGVDISREMIVRARQSARAQRIANATFRTMDCGRLDFADSTFDVVVSCFGFQIFVDPDRVATEAHRVLRPGGRIAVSIWGPGERTPVIDAIIAPMLEHAEPDEDGYLPTPYEMGGPGEMAGLLRKAGFTRTRERRVSYTARFRDADHYLASILSATPIGHSLSEEPRRVQAQVRRATRANLRAWTTPDGIAVPGEAVLVTARR